MNPYHEHEFEVAPGLPEALPISERVLWQGAPSAYLLGVHALHIRKIVVYFVLMLTVQALYLAGEPEVDIWPSVLLSASLAATCVVLLASVAWYAARNTLYTLTNRRWIMRIGMVLTITLNLPLKQIDSASVRQLSNGAGDLALDLKGPRRVGWLHLWPHAKAWTLRHPQPALRCVTQVQTVAELFLQAWMAENPNVSIQRGMNVAEADHLDLRRAVSIQAS